jgi:ribose transport system substrate-binding protein
MLRAGSRRAYGFAAVPLAALAVMTGCGSSDSSSDTSASAGDTGTAAAASTTAAASVADLGVIKPYEMPEVTKPKKSYDILALVPHQFEPFALSMSEEAKRYGTELGVNVTVRNAGGYTGQNIQEQIGQIETGISQGVDAIMIWVTDPDAVVPALQKAKDAGIKIIAWSVPPNMEGMDSQVIGDYVWDGRTIAEVLYKSLGGKGSVMTVLGGAPSLYYRQMKDGVAEATKATPDIDLVAEPNIPDFDPAKTQGLVETQLVRTADLNGVITSTGSQALGALDAAKAAGKEGQLKIMAEIITDCTQIDALKKGDLFAILGVPAVYYARLGVATTVQVLEGESVPPKQIIEGNIYTADNIDEAPLDEEVLPKYIKGCTN